MGLTVAGLWTIYIIVTVASFIVLWILFALASRCNSCSGLNWGTAFFWGALIGGLTVFILGFFINPDELTQGDFTSLSVLYLIAFLLPVFTAFIIMWYNGLYAARRCTDKDPCVKKVSCDPCKVPKKKQYQAQTYHQPKSQPCDPCEKPKPKPCDPCEKPKPQPCDPCANPSYSRW